MHTRDPVEAIDSLDWYDSLPRLRLSGAQHSADARYWAHRRGACLRAHAVEDWTAFWVPVVFTNGHWGRRECRHTIYVGRPRGCWRACYREASRLCGQE